MHFVNIFTRLIRQPFCSVFGWFGVTMNKKTVEIDGLRLKYEPEYDLLSVWLGAPQVADNVEVEPGISVRISRDQHQVVGVEIVDAAARLHRDASSLTNQAYVRGLLDKYGPLALNELSHAH
ncbi:MAG TPA: DUF2283 domain-containing protein [Vicinamibacterales bacterium]|jgi:uncharacterized protein YuzE|nr:DUF2283 domain-containing protein [Vicinamibacterales bacterium]